MDAPGDGRTGSKSAGSMLAGIAPGSRWVDARGTVCVVSWVRGIGVVGYRLAAMHNRTGNDVGSDVAGEAVAAYRVMDAARFLRNFAPLPAPPEKTSERAA